MYIYIYIQIESPWKLISNVLHPAKYYYKITCDYTLDRQNKKNLNLITAAKLSFNKIIFYNRGEEKKKQGRRNTHDKLTEINKDTNRKKNIHIYAICDRSVRFYVCLNEDFWILPLIPFQ